MSKKSPKKSEQKSADEGLRHFLGLKGPGPWHLVNQVTGKHCGPFSTELDAQMARSIATGSWHNAIAMDRETFDAHLAQS